METTQIGSKQHSRIMLISSILYFREGSKRKKKRENEMRADYIRGFGVSHSSRWHPSKEEFKCGI